MRKTGECPVVPIELGEVNSVPSATHVSKELVEILSRPTYAFAYNHSTAVITFSVSCLDELISRYTCFATC